MSAGFVCGICLKSHDSAGNPLNIAFPGKEGGVAHNECFQKTRNVWNGFHTNIETIVKNVPSASKVLARNSLHEKTIQHVYNDELPSRGKKTILEVLEDSNMGNVELAKILDKALSISY